MLLERVMRCRFFGDDWQIQAAVFMRAFKIVEDINLWFGSHLTSKSLPTV